MYGSNSALMDIEDFVAPSQLRGLGQSQSVPAVPTCASSSGIISGGMCYYPTGSNIGGATQLCLPPTELVEGSSVAGLTAGNSYCVGSPPTMQPAQGCETVYLYGGQTQLHCPGSNNPVVGGASTSWVVPEEPTPPVPAVPVPVPAVVTPAVDIPTATQPIAQPAVGPPVIEESSPEFAEVEIATGETLTYDPATGGLSPAMQEAYNQLPPPDYTAHELYLANNPPPSPSLQQQAMSAVGDFANSLVSGIVSANVSVGTAIANLPSDVQPQVAGVVAAGSAALQAPATALSTLNNLSSQISSLVSGYDPETGSNANGITSQSTAEMSGDHIMTHDQFLAYQAANAYVNNFISTGQGLAASSGSSTPAQQAVQAQIKSYIMQNQDSSLTAGQQYQAAINLANYVSNLQQQIAPIQNSITQAGQQVGAFLIGVDTNPIVGVLFALHGMGALSGTLTQQQVDTHMAPFIKTVKDVITKMDALRRAVHGMKPHAIKTCKTGYSLVHNTCRKNKVTTHRGIGGLTDNQKGLAVVFGLLGAWWLLKKR